jgi:hypothetical protein
LALLRHDRRELAAIFLGGALGTLARAGLETLAAPDHRRLRLDAVDSNTRQPCAAALTDTR